MTTGPPGGQAPIALALQRRSQQGSSARPMASLPYTFEAMSVVNETMSSRVPQAAPCVVTSRRHDAPQCAGTRSPARVRPRPTASARGCAICRVPNFGQRPVTAACLAAAQQARPNIPETVRRARRRRSARPHLWAPPRPSRSPAAATPPRACSYAATRSAFAAVRRRRASARRSHEN